MSIKQLVSNLIKTNPTIVFSKSYCPYCKAAKEALTQRNFEYKAIELDLEPDGSTIQSYLQTFTNQSTVPNIFIDQKHIGGYDSLMENFTSGKL